jgi:hypothetical protein
MKYIVSTIWWDKDGTTYKRTKEYKNKKYALKYFEKEEEKVCENYGYLVTLSTKNNNKEIVILYPKNKALEVEE